MNKYKMLHSSTKHMWWSDIGYSFYTLGHRFKSGSFKHVYFIQR